MIQSIKDLEKLLKLLRKQGVIDFKHGELSLHMGDLPSQPVAAQEEDIESFDPYANFPEGMLTPEQLAHYASGGLPENDPLIQRSTG